MVEHTGPDNGAFPGGDGSIDEAIKAFKGILEVFPGDMGALESLFAACVQADYRDAALAHGLRLAELLSEQGEWKKVRDITAKLLELEVDDERVEVLHQAAVDSAGFAEHPPSAANKPVTEASGEPAQSGTAPVRSLKRDLSGELDLAWMLLQNEVITEDQYEKAVSSLSESQSSAKASVCLLQELASIDRVNMDKVLGFLSAETNTPYIDIDRFEINPDIAALVSSEEARRYGVLPFGQLQDELMVAILNPVDEKVRVQAGAFFGRPLHFFLSSPEAMQEVIDAFPHS